MNDFLISYYDNMAKNKFSYYINLNYLLKKYSLTFKDLRDYIIEHPNEEISKDLYSYNSNICLKFQNYNINNVFFLEKIIMKNYIPKTLLFLINEKKNN